MKKTCSICDFSDGKWEERIEAIHDSSLPVCEKCKADGWTSDTEEIRKAIVNDPELSKHVSYKSPL